MFSIDVSIYMTIQRGQKVKKITEKYKYFFTKPPSALPTAAFIQIKIQLAFFNYSFL